jgi:hypothetical protein
VSDGQKRVFRDDMRARDRRRFFHITDPAIVLCLGMRGFKPRIRLNRGAAAFAETLLRHNDVLLIRWVVKIPKFILARTELSAKYRPARLAKGVQNR